MRLNPLSLLSLVFFGLAYYGAYRVRRDLETGRARLVAASSSRAPTERATSPARYWLIVAANTIMVFLFVLVCVAAMRVGFLRARL